MFDSLISYMEINLKGCWEIQHGKDWVESEAKENYDLWIILDGEVKIEIQDKEYLIKPGDVFLLYPQLLYKAVSKTESCRFVFIHFDVKVGNNIRALEEFPFWGVLPAEEVQSEVVFFMNWYKKYRNKVPISSLFLRGYFIVLLSKIIKFQIETNRDIAAPKSTKQNIARLYPTLIYINNNIHKPIYIKELANTVSMSESHFITFFKKKVGVSPANYVLKERMKRAMEYLYEGIYSVKEVAMLVGYGDQYTFSKAFKKIYQIAPSKIIQTTHK